VLQAPPTESDEYRSRFEEAIELSLVIPLYNEEDRLSEFAPEILSWCSERPGKTELLLVDDGSSDDTVQIARSVQTPAESVGVPCQVIECLHRGKGAAVAAGLSVSRGIYSGFCDVDLSTPLEQLEIVINQALSNNVLALASRDFAGAVVVTPESRLREALGRTYNRILRAAVVRGISDTQCGAKIAPASVWSDVLPSCQEIGWAWDVEVIAIAQRFGFEVSEVPVVWHHDDRTRMRLLTGGLSMLAAVPRIWWRLRWLPAQPNVNARLRVLSSSGRA
jgi:dolichyl-phosphate beta-glucosyltransferase